MVIPLGVVGSHSLIRQDSMVLTSVRKTIALSINTTSMSFSDIDGTTATATKTKVRWCRRGTLFVGNIENVGGEVWLNKLIAARNRFEQTSPTGARFKLHRLSREAGLPFLSWGENCQSCVDNSVRAPREAFLPNQPYWRARISSEMYQGIGTLQSL